jgi:hypothetical protein
MVHQQGSVMPLAILPPSHTPSPPPPIVSHVHLYKEGQGQISPLAF